MNIKILILIKLIFLKNQINTNNGNLTSIFEKNFLIMILPKKKNFFFLGKKEAKDIKGFLKKSIKKFSLTQRFLKLKFFKKRIRGDFFTFVKIFFLNFLENFFKKKVLFNFKKGTNKLLLKQISFRKFDIRYFKKNLGVTRQIIGILYYSFLLKDSSIFVNFLKRVLEVLNLKLHKRVFKGIKKLIKDIFKPLFNYLGLNGLFFNVKGKIGVSGSAKKRRYFFYFGRHSLTNRTLKMDCKNTTIWTPTGVLGFTFLVFF